MKKSDKCNKQVSLQRHINYVDNIRDNLNRYNGDLTLPEIAESAGIPFSTLKNILYGNSSDCKLSTAASFAKFLGITIDELVGSDTLTEDAKESLSIYHELPERSKYLARWFVKHQKALCSNNDSTKSVAVMIPKDANGYLHPTNEFKTLSLIISIIFSLYSTITLLCKNTYEIPFILYNRNCSISRTYVLFISCIFTPWHYYKNIVILCRILKFE